MITMNKDLAKALEAVACILLSREYYDTYEMKISSSCLESEDTPEAAIRKSIGLGGGCSMDGCGQYWFAHWTQGPTIHILDKDSNEHKVPAGKFMAIVRTIWDREKNKQLQLF